MPTEAMELVPDGALSAFRRLLTEASAGGHAKVDAIVALSQRTVHVATWMPTHDGFRTVVNAEGQSALPIFTGVDELRRGAERFGWTAPDGSVASQEIGARQAMRYVLSHDLSFIVVDIASPHALEIEPAEVEPLLEAMAKRDSSGPFAAVGRISSSMLEAVGAHAGAGRSSQAPRRMSSAPVRSAEIGPPSTGVVPVVTRTPSSPGVVAAAAPSATFGSGSSVSIEPLAEPPAEELLASLAELLRGYPEVEWAALFGAARGPAPVRPTVGLRVDTAYRARVNEIIAALRRAGDAQGAALDVLLLDDAPLMRQARAEALVFFPWVRKSRT